MIELFLARGLAAGFDNRAAEAAADLDYAAQLAERTADSLAWCRAKMTSSLIGTVPPVPMIHSSTPW